MYTAGLKPYVYVPVENQCGRVAESVGIGENSWVQILGLRLLCAVGEDTCVMCFSSEKEAIIVPPWSGFCEDEMRKDYTKKS